MKRKINHRFLLLSITSILLTTLVLSFVFYRMTKNQVFEELRETLEIFRGENAPEPQGNLRITLIGKNGDVIYDSVSSGENLENHLARPEISQAFKTGAGKTVRKSNTLSESLFYYAELLENGNVLRVGKRASNVFAILFSALPAVIITIFILFGLSIILSHFLTREIVRPIENMADNLDSVDLHPLYPELLPFAKKIRSQHDTILSNVNMRQEFTANVSHELKTPLTAISGYAELIQNGMADQTQLTHFAGEIHKNSDRLLNLINDILRLSELDSTPKTDFNALSKSEFAEGEKADLAKIACETVEMLKIEAVKNDISIKYSGPETLELPFSKELVRELCYNLVQNAIRYNKTGGKVRVSVEKVSSGGNGETGQWSSGFSLRAFFTVEDTGIGIPLEAQDRVFERFYRVDKSRSKAVGGTGLGLAIVKHIAQITGGKISLESKLGLGTKITVMWE